MVPGLAGQDSVEGVAVGVLQLGCPQALGKLDGRYLPTFSCDFGRKAGENTWFQFQLPETGLLEDLIAGNGTEIDTILGIGEGVASPGTQLRGALPPPKRGVGIEKVMLTSRIHW